MKQGGPSLPQRGFTMVEVLIVLAVTSALLVVAMVLINGRLSRTEFAVGSRQLSQNIESVINETGSGYSASGQNFACTGNKAGNAQTFSNTSKFVGTNDTCIFVGKVIVLDKVNRPRNMRVIPLSGNRLYDDGGKVRDVMSLDEAHPTALAPSSTPGSIEDQSTTVQLPSGFSFVNAWTVDTAAPIPTDKFALAVVSDIAANDAHHFKVTAITGWNPVAAGTQEAVAVNNASVGAFTTHASLNLCFAHEATTQSVELILGRDGGPGVETVVHQGASC